MTKENTHISNAIDATRDSMFEYDQNAKNILADRQILARILKYTLDEFGKMDIEEVISSIEGEPFVGEIPMEPGLTNSRADRSAEMERRAAFRMKALSALTSGSTRSTGRINARY